MALVQVTNRPKYTGPAVAEQLTQMYNIAKQARSQPSQEWKRNFRLTMNRVATALPAAQGVRANEVYPTIDARIAWMTDQEIACSVTPAADPYSPFYDTLDMLGEQLEVIINSVYATNQWYAEVNKMLKDKDFADKLVSLGFQPIGGSVEDMKPTIQRDRARWKKVIEAAGITAE